MKSQTHGGDGYVKIEAGIGVMLQTRECFGPPELEEARMESIPEDWKEHGPANT